MQKRYNNRFAIVGIISLIVGLNLMIFHESLRVQYLVTEQDTILIGEDIWNQGPYHPVMLKVNSSFPNASIFIPRHHDLEIPHFNISPGLVTINVSLIIYVGDTNITGDIIRGPISGDLVEGFPPPVSSPSARQYYRDTTITVHLEGENSTVQFMYSVWNVYYHEYTMVTNWTTTVTANIFGLELATFVGGGMIACGILVFGMFLESRRVILMDDKNN